MERKAVITGVGVVSPAGRGLGALFEGVCSGMGFIAEIDRFDSSRYLSRHAGVVPDMDLGPVFPKRLLKKLDRFSQMALLATDDAIRDAGLDMAAEDRDRVGIVIGNALGGWAFAEEELRDLHRFGLREVSPYQATAWFPAAPQGQVSMHYGITGFAKTIISDLASSHVAIGYAARAITTGKADVVVAGGAEAPVSPYALLCCNTSGELSVEGAYKPFDRDRDGYVIGEGAGMLIIEERGRAKARGARVYAEVRGFAHTSDGVSPVDPDPSGRGMERAMRAALERASLSAGDVDYLMPSGNGGYKTDASEASAISRVFGVALESGLPVGVPKALYGNLLGASGALDAAVACAAISNATAPVATNCDDPEDGCRWAKSYGNTHSKAIKNVVINSLGRGGVNACLVLGRD